MSNAMRESGGSFTKSAVTLGLGERGDDVGERAEVDATGGFDRPDGTHFAALDAAQGNVEDFQRRRNP
jgi:hypothetical protein